jgi:DNA-binding HxlR family transcriptional regulator
MRGWRFRSRRQPRHTYVPNCAWHARSGKLGRCRAAKERCERKIRKVISLRSFRRRQDTMNTMQKSKTAPSIFIGRWTPKILFSLKERPYRHGELRRQLGSVSQRMLTRTLRNLESAGLIARRVTKSKAITVEYSLTQLGRTLIAPLGGMCRWAKRHRRNMSADVRLLKAYQTPSG